MVAQRVDGVVFQVEFSESRTGRKGAVGEGCQTVRPQPEDAEAGQLRGHSGGHFWNLERRRKS